MWRAGWKFRAIVLVGVLAGALTPVGLAGPAWAGGGCHEPMVVSASGVAVDAKGLCFFPTVLYVKVGATVTWTNRDEVEHSVTGLGAAWGSGYETLRQGQSVTATFAAPGIYPYTCIIHPGMVGAVVAGRPTAPSGSETDAALPATSATNPPSAVPLKAAAPAAPTSGGPWRWVSLVALALLLAASTALVLLRVEVRRARRNARGILGAER